MASGIGTAISLYGCPSLLRSSCNCSFSASKSVCCSSLASSHDTYISVFLGAHLTMVSMCPSVSSPKSCPWSSHTTRFAHRRVFSCDSMSSLSSGWLRCGANRQLLVVNTVPSPSLSTEPPSSTKSRCSSISHSVSGSS